MPEVRLIDANALHEKIIEENGHNYAATENVAQILLRIETAPTIEAEPVRRGRWECVNDDSGIYRCSSCGEEWYLEAGTPEENRMKYCAACGARMCGGDDNAKSS